MNDSVEGSLEYHHLIAQGVPADVAWRAAWIDGAYNYLMQNGMDGAGAYAQAVSTFAANGLDLRTTGPESTMREVLTRGFKAEQIYSTLDPRQPEASFVLQHPSERQGKPS